MSQKYDFDCQNCGACCVGMDIKVPEHEAPAVNAALKKMSLPVLRTRRWLGKDDSYHSADIYMPRDACACAALRRDSKPGGKQEAACQIYGEYPKVCGEFEPGSTQCVTSRVLAGITVVREPVSFILKLSRSGSFHSYFEDWVKYFIAYGRAEDAQRVQAWRDELDSHYLKKEDVELDEEALAMKLSGRAKALKTISEVAAG